MTFHETYLVTGQGTVFRLTQETTKCIYCHIWNPTVGEYGVWEQYSRHHNLQAAWAYMDFVNDAEYLSSMIPSLMDNPGYEARYSFGGY